MSKKYKLITFFAFLGVLVLTIVGHNFVRYYITKDYPVHVFTACDPTEHSCFEIDPEMASPMFQSGPYAKIEIPAMYAPSCLDEHTCSDFSCDGIADCQITYCSEDSQEDGETCTNENQ